MLSVTLDSVCILQVWPLKDKVTGMMECAVLQCLLAMTSSHAPPYCRHAQASLGWLHSIAPAGLTISLTCLHAEHDRQPYTFVALYKGLQNRVNSVLQPVMFSLWSCQDPISFRYTLHGRISSPMKLLWSRFTTTHLLLLKKRLGVRTVPCLSLSVLSILICDPLPFIKMAVGWSTLVSLLG